MAKTPHNDDPKRNPDPSQGPPPKAKKPDGDSHGSLPEIDPKLLESGELPELAPGLFESGEFAELDPSLLDSAEMPEAPLPPQSPSKGQQIPDSDEVQYDTPPPVGEPGSFDAAISLGGVPDTGDMPTAGLSKIPASSDSGSGTDWVVPSHADGSDSGSLVIPTADPASEIGSDLGMGSDLGIGSDHLAVQSKDPSSIEIQLPSGTPISSDLRVSDNASNVPVGEDPLGSGKYEPISPSAGWLDSMEHIPPLASQMPPETHDAYGVPAEGVESSDIFGSGTIEKATPGEHSDVIAATAHGEGKWTGEPPSRPSDVALSFDQPPGGSTSPEMGGSSELPVAEEVVEAESLSEEPSGLFSSPPPGLPFDSARFADATLPDATEPVDVPEFGKTPEPSADASSILADLTEPSESGNLDSSAVKIEAPDIGRTLSSDHGEGTEFDLTIGDALPHELIAEAASDHGPAEWENLPGPEMFANDKTIPEVHLGDPARVVPVDPTWVPEEPTGEAPQSSIFSQQRPPSEKTPPEDGSEVSLAAMPAPGESDSSVEFSDHPEAESEASASSIMSRPATPKPPAGKPKPKSKHSASEFELPPESPDAADWSLTHETHPTGRRDSGDSSILSRETITQQEMEKEGTLPEPRQATPAPKAKDKPAPPKPGRPVAVSLKGKTPSKGDRDPSDPSVEIDWLAGSSSQELSAAAAAAAELGVPDPLEPTPPPPRKTKTTRPEQPVGEETSKKSAWIGGALIGMVIAGGGFAGAYFGNLIPNSDATTQRPPGGTGQQGTNTTNGGTGTPAGTAADAVAAIRAGDPAKAKQIIAGLKDDSTSGKALAGEAGLFALVQERGTVIAADHPDLVAARENLQALVNDDTAATTADGKKAAAKAAIQLGISHELAGDRAAAQKVYEDAKAKFPDYADTFDAALDRLAVTRTSEPMSLRLPATDAHQLLVAITLLQADGKADAEAGVYFWKAVNKATGERYTEAVEEIKKAKATHAKQAKAKAGQGLNPLSDPLEQIFPRCCDDLKAYWELRAAIYANPAVGDLYKKDGAEKAFMTLATAQKNAITAAANLKDATDKLTKANADLTKAKTDLKKTEDGLNDSKTMVTTLLKDAKAAEEKLDAEAKARKLADAARTEAEVARQKSEQFIASLAKELQGAKLLPEKYDAADLLAAQKRTAERATGPNLGTLLPSTMMVVGGGGLSAAQLVDIAERLSKAETAAKTAADRLATETGKLKTDHAAELKKLTDGYAADLKKLTDTHATDISKLKDDQKAELKKANDKFALDAKQLKDAYEGKAKDLEGAVAKERDRVAAITEQFKRDLGNAIGPVEALDLWLPLLTELRRPADADPALATATKVIASAPADSEDAAKARTVAGLALLIKNDLTLAKAQLQAAKASPAHKPALAAMKRWAEAADTGLASLSDPLAPYRRPVTTPGRDLLVAARFLDAGITAYREGRYTVAVAALGDSVKADPANPIAWYYLGAARWDTGATDAAKGDFQQGATREAASDMTARSISSAIAPIQGAARDALTASRP